MKAVVYRFPEQTRVARRIPKERLYQHGKPPDKVKQAVIQQLDRIVWQYKLAPETVNLPATPDILEIQVLELFLKEEIAALDEAVLLLLCKSIPHPIYCVIQAGDRLQFALAYPPPGALAGTRPQLHISPWIAQNKATQQSQPLPPATNLSGLYAALLRGLLPVSPLPGESLAAQMDRLRHCRELQQQIKQLEGALAKEKQFKRKVQINAERRALQATLRTLNT